MINTISTEKSLIGSILCSPELMDYAVENITWHTFYDSYHATIFKKMCDLHDDGVRPDVSVLCDELDSVEQSKLLDTMDNHATSTSIENYCKILKEKHTLRKLTLKFRVLAQNIDENTINITDLETEINKILEETNIKAKNQGRIVKARSLKSDMLSYYDNGFKNTGVSTGWPGVDRHYKPAKGTLNIITGMPGHGKSEVVDALMVNISMAEKWKWAVFSPENFPYELHIQKIAEKLIQKPMMRKKNRMVKIELESAMDWINEHIIFIQPDEENLSLNTILALQKHAIEKYGVDGCIVDPWNEIEINLQKGESETDYIGRSLSRIRRFARNNDVVYYIVAHPAKMYKNKKGEYDVPTMYNISGSAHWYNKADNGLCVHRDFENSMVDLHIQKIKFKTHGYVGCVPLKYNRDNGTFEEEGF